MKTMRAAYAMSSGDITGGAAAAGSAMVVVEDGREKKVDDAGCRSVYEYFRLRYLCEWHGA